MGIVYYQHYQSKVSRDSLEINRTDEVSRADNEKYDHEQVDFSVTSTPPVFNYSDGDYFADRIFLGKESSAPLYVASVGFERSWLEGIVQGRRVPRYNIHFVFEGSGYFNSMPVSKGQAFISMPNEKYSIINDQKTPMRHGWISLGGSDLENQIKILGLPTVSVINVNDIDKVQRLIKDTVYGSHHKLGSVENVANLMFSRFFRTLSLLDYREPPKTTKSRSHNKYVGIVNDYINTHYHYNITVTDLARHAGVSVSYLRHIFAVNLGISPQTAIINKKMEMAKQILLNTSASIAMIAAECGYSDQSAFCKVFKKTQGISPLKYRKINAGRYGK